MSGANTTGDEDSERRQHAVNPSCKPLVSVLTPSFNQGRWLGDAIQSVRLQSYDRIEHVVMDGGSTDTTREILEASVGAVTWRSEPDSGQSHALNKAFAECSGDIIGWINADDAYLTRDVVPGVVAVFERNPDVGVVYGHAVLVDGHGRILQILYVPPHNASLLRQHNYVVQPAVFVRRSVIEDAFVDVGFDYMMDRELWLRLAQSTQFMRLDKILAVDRHHADRKSYTRPDLAAADRRVLAARYNLDARDHEARKRIRKLLYRVRGLRLVGTVHQADLAFDGRVDGRFRLAARQTLVPRRWMSPSAT